MSRFHTICQKKSRFPTGSGFFLAIVKFPMLKSALKLKGYFLISTYHILFGTGNFPHDLLYLQFSL